MATSVMKNHDIVLDDKTYTIRPLKIKALRVFLDKMKNFDGITDESEVLGFLSEVSEFAFKACNKDIPDGFEFEDEVDFDDIKAILKICGGVDLDANLNAATA